MPLPLPFSQRASVASCWERVRQAPRRRRSAAIAHARSRCRIVWAVAFPCAGGPRLRARCQLARPRHHSHSLPSRLHACRVADAGTVQGRPRVLGPRTARFAAAGVRLSAWQPGRSVRGRGTHVPPPFVTLAPPTRPHIVRTLPTSHLQHQAQQARADTTRCIITQAPWPTTRQMVGPY